MARFRTQPAGHELNVGHYPGKMEARRERYQTQRRSHWDKIALSLEHWRGWGGYYHRRLAEVYQFLVTPGLRVLEIGCAEGDLLAALSPELGVGVDFSAEMVKRAMRRHPDLCFIQADAHALPLDQPFDIIILSDLVNDLWDVQVVFEQIARLSTPRTRIILNVHSRLWELPLKAAEHLGLAKPNLELNWLVLEDIAGLLRLADFEVIRQWQEILWPLPTPLLVGFFNRFLVRIWPFNHLALTNFVVAHPAAGCQSPTGEPVVSVVVPARNEAGNIQRVFARTPRMGRQTELVFVEGHSTDDTYEVIREAIGEHPEWACQLLKQEGVGKGDAIRMGFAQAKGDILIILDADLTVPPEDLSRFYDVLRSGKGEFVNGVRLVYPMEKEAMPFFNLIGNKFFSLAFSWLLGQPVKDTLCGTKALYKVDYEKIAAGRAYFGDFDPFGDFDLLFGAAKQQMKIVDMPIRYRERTYGTTNIQRWKHGWLLIKMVLFAIGRLKAV